LESRKHTNGVKTVVIAKTSTKVSLETTYQIHIKVHSNDKSAGVVQHRVHVGSYRPHERLVIIGVAQKKVTQTYSLVMVSVFTRIPNNKARIERSRNMQFGFAVEYFSVFKVI